jgi:hypothetical protein
MFRFFFKKRCIKRQRKKLYFTYKYYRFVQSNSCKNSVNFYNINFFLTLPKRQQHFNFYDLKLNKHFNFSCGTFLVKMGRKSKFFKRSYKNIMSLTLHMKKLYGYYFKYIYMFVINNFNYRQYLFFKKFLEMLNPHIYYFLHRQSFMPRFLNKRRIKRRVLRQLT